MTFPLEASTLVQPNNVALFGGAFDPITLGHEIVAEMVFSRFGMDLWFMPCYDHFFNKELCPSQHRCNMVKLITDHCRIRARVCSSEIDRRHTGSMYETIQCLRKEHPGVAFHIVIGMDNANSVHRWHKGELLVRDCPFIVVGRGGYKPLTEWYLNPPHLFVASEMTISATDARQAIERQDNRLASNLLNPYVWDYIKANKLYGYREEE